MSLPDSRGDVSALAWRGGTQAGGGLLAEQLSDLARVMQHETDVQGTLDSIVRSAVVTVPGAEHASLSAVRRRRHVVTVAATGELPRAVDQAQYTAGEGPCLDALYDRAAVQLPDLAYETRWPKFVALVRLLPLGSMLAVQLYVEGDDLGALNLQSRHPHAFTGESVRVALLFAAHAAVAMAAAEQHEHLTAALCSRDLTGQAKGILMERYKVTAAQAFAMLVRVSSITNRRLVDIAEELSTTGSMPQP
jgi:transcriptional regulator with GAF, ATPase, and Fis domain